FDVRRVANDDVKPASRNRAVEFNKPMKRAVAALPCRECFLLLFVVSINTVIAGKIHIEPPRDVSLDFPQRGLRRGDFRRRTGEPIPANLQRAEVAKTLV